MSIPPIAAKASRYDPYKNYKFRIRLGGKVVAGISKVSGLKQSTEPVVHREGGDPGSSRIKSGASKFEPITLERGITHDPEFENWAKRIRNEKTDANTSLKEFRKDVIIELLDEQAVVTKTYKVYNCWVSEYRAVPETGAHRKEVAIEHIVLQHEGWE